MFILAIIIISKNHSYKAGHFVMTGFLFIDIIFRLVYNSPVVRHRVELVKRTLDC